MNDLCILIPTFERYRTVAQFTRAKLDEHWPGHPPIFFCGLSGPAGDETFLPLRDDPADWMALVRTAVSDLQARGFRQCYLILDDHPPLDRCHARHLQETLPRLMDRLNASFINLLGWGQHRPRQGQILGAEDSHIEKPAREYPWKFALHPGLWDLRAFSDILDVLLKNSDLRERTCWKFERRAGMEDFPLPEQWRDTAYRVCGRAMSARPGHPFRAWQRRAELAGFDLLRFFIRVLRGPQARERFDARYLGVYHFYEGPYPLFWSGLMKKGRLNSDLVFFLRWSRRDAQLAELHRVLDPLIAAAPDSAAP